ncbi:hypothetical protein EVAR_100107_1 [Eumeta japonica]|uniref:Uncharacterized protein n=1 Tax=Eumeta variegata TaxID=151549 RepID=A0A4C1YWF3_EUMVA|nr:hypothetical protein EVAR_100107_1 [Eumeta japonica]
MFETKCVIAREAAQPPAARPTRNGPRRIKITRHCTNERARAHRIPNVLTRRNFVKNQSRPRPTENEEAPLSNERSTGRAAPAILLRCAFHSFVLRWPVHARNRVTVSLKEAANS